MQRKETNPELDKKVFKNTATTMKRKNLPGKAMRGGIRL